MRGVCPPCLASRHRWSACSRGRISAAPNFWKKLPENRAGKLHISKAASSARQARSRAINDKGQARCSIRSLPLTPSPTLFPSTRRRKMGSSSFGSGESCRRAACRLKLANRASGRLDSAFAFARPSLGLLSAGIGQRVFRPRPLSSATAALAFSSASALAWSKIEARSASKSLMR
jgi:hypothetical protein